jgi:hypothetical protein
VGRPDNKLREIRGGPFDDDVIPAFRLAPRGCGLASAAVMDGRRLLRNPNHAFDPTHDATDHAAHDATNHGTDRPGRALPDGDALLASTHDALGLGRKRRRQRGNNDDGHDELRLHEQTPPPDVCGFSTNGTADLVSPLWRQREANVAANQQNRRMWPG